MSSASTPRSSMSLLPPSSSTSKRPASALVPSSPEEAVAGVAGRPWSDDELTVLSAHQQLGQTSQWKALSELLPGRSADACRSKYKASFPPAPSTSAETDEGFRSPRTSLPPPTPPGVTSPRGLTRPVEAPPTAGGTMRATSSSASIPLPSRSTPRTDASPVEIRSNPGFVSVNGRAGLSMAKVKARQEQIGKLYIEASQADGRRRQHQSRVEVTEQEITRLQQDLNIQREELARHEEHVTRLRAKMDVLANQAMQDEGHG